jgi:hypothetical protein
MRCCAMRGGMRWLLLSTLGTITLNLVVVAVSFLQGSYCYTLHSKLLNVCFPADTRSVVSHDGGYRRCVTFIQNARPHFSTRQLLTRVC